MFEVNYGIRNIRSARFATGVSVYFENIMNLNK
jgi:hypothetical protein